MDGVNRVTLMGNLGADPELVYGQRSNNAVLRMSVATTESWFDQAANERREEVEWHNVVMFGKRAEGLSKFLVKGMTVYVEGKLQTRSYDKDGVKHWSTKVIALDVKVPTNPRRERSNEGGGGGGGGYERQSQQPRTNGFQARGGSGGGRPQRSSQPQRDAREEYDNLGPGPTAGSTNPDDEDIPF